jgi:hypothetical protein
MKISNWIQNLVQSIWNGVGKLFQPSNDDYPETGVQPFSGDPADDNEKYS